jgi:hypothetical protein
MSQEKAIFKKELGFARSITMSSVHTSQAMIVSNYREVVTRQDAERYWSIKPAQAAANLISIKRGIST